MFQRNPFRVVLQIVSGEGNHCCGSKKKQRKQIFKIKKGERFASQLLFEKSIKILLFYYEFLSCREIKF